MSFFNPNKKSTKKSEAHTEWDTLKQPSSKSVETPDKRDVFGRSSSESAKTISEDENHRRKIINYHTSKNFSNTPVDETAEYNFYKQVGHELGQDSYAKEESFLSKLNGNFEDPKRGANWIAEQISKNEDEQTLFDAICLQMGLNHEQGDITPETISDFMNASTDANFSLKTPVGFEEPRRAVLDYLDSDESNLSASDADDYRSAMDSLEDHLYGKRFAYHQAYENIRRETPSHLGWAEIEGGPTHEEYYDVECKSREAKLSAKTHEESPEYQESFDRGVELAKQYLEELAKNPDFADAFQAGFDSIAKKP